MKLYLIRHGESENNLNCCYTGWLQVHLTKKGIEDARAIRPLLKNVPFDKIYASDLIRAKQTAENALPGCTYEETNLLREINVGSLAGKYFSTIDDNERQHAGIYGYSKYSGESREEFNCRIHNFLATIEDHNYSNVAAFSHAGWLKGMLNEVVGTTIPGNTICCSNCTVAIFEYQNKTWRLHSWINPL